MAILWGFFRITVVPYSCFIFKGNLILSFGFLHISAFKASVDCDKSGSVFAQLTQLQTLIQKAIIMNIFIIFEFNMIFSSIIEWQSNFN